MTLLDWTLLFPTLLMLASLVSLTLRSLTRSRR